VRAGGLTCFLQFTNPCFVGEIIFFFYFCTMKNVYSEKEKRVASPSLPPAVERMTSQKKDSKDLVLLKEMQSGDISTSTSSQGEYQLGDACQYVHLVV
jgi:hypothetical protein